MLLTAVLLCQLEPVYAVLHQNFPWLPETPPIELPQFYLTREDAVRSQEENDGNSGPEEDQPVMTNGPCCWSMRTISSIGSSVRNWR